MSQVEAGMQQALQIGELNAVAVIPRPLDDLEQTTPGCLIEEQPKPLLIPLKIKEKEEEAELLPLKIKEKEGEAELITLPDLTNSQIKTNDDFSYYL